jgi:acyl-CoA dehydrogenase
MPMNCQPIPTLDERINDIRMRTAEIVNEDILPNEAFLWGRDVPPGEDHESWSHTTERLELRAAIKERVKRAGLWAPHLPQEYGGMGLDFLAHAYMNEVLAYAIGAASLFGVVAPNSGNQSILVKYGTEEQKQKWLLPLIEGAMESGFSMTEPQGPTHGRSTRRRCATGTTGSSTATSGSRRTASTPTSSSSCAG